MMNKYQHEIDRMLNLKYSNAEKRYENGCTEKFEQRIGNGFTVSKKNVFLNNYVLAHISSVCTEIPNCNICDINKFCNYFRKKSRKQIQINDIKIVDLFCGAGGFSLGFSQLGFKTILAIDNQQCCIDTYRHNHPEVREESIICKDIEVADEDIIRTITDAEIDVVIGGPPCQGFSTANRQRMIDDPRNHLYKYFVNTIRRIKPKFFVMENVEGILNIQQQIIEDFTSLEERYQVMPIKINAIDFGVPQNRKRVFFIGTKLDINIVDIIENIKLYANEMPKTVLNDALFGLRELKANNEKNATRKESEKSGSVIELNDIDKNNEYIKLINQGKDIKYVFNHKARYNNERDILIFSRLNPGDKSDDPKIADIMPYTNRNEIFKDKYFRLQGDKPCKTITAHMKYDGNMYIHPYQARGLTPREAARVQSYPDDYFFCGPYTKTFMQIGNSVPPLVARIIAKAIKNYLL